MDPAEHRSNEAENRSPEEAQTEAQRQEGVRKQADRTVSRRDMCNTFKSLAHVVGIPEREKRE